MRGRRNVGGFRGKDGPADGCFWDIESSGVPESSGGTGLTTAEMQTASTFLDVGWDFVDETENGEDDVWYIVEGVHYPRLVWELADSPWPHNAFAPNPQDGATGLTASLTLRWRADGPALLHDVFLGDDLDAVVTATTRTAGVYRGRQPAGGAAYDAGSLEWGKSYYWRVDVVSEGNPDLVWTGHVWSFAIADCIVPLYPADGALTFTQSPIVLRWQSHGIGMQYDVYFGDDEAAVAGATVGSPDVYRGRQLAEATTYDPGELAGNKMYYWRIDAVDDTDPRSPWRGDVWSFATTSESVVDVAIVDDFETYTNEVGQRVFETWIDGLGYTEPLPGNPGNGTGSLVGYPGGNRHVKGTHVGE